MFPVLGTVSTVVKALMNQLRTDDPTLNFVFDPTLTAETSIAAWRDANTNEDKVPTNTFPLLGWNRTPIIPSKFLGKKMTQIQTIELPGDAQGNATTLHVAFSDFTFSFIHIQKDKALSEQFEILYNTELGMQSKELTIDLSVGGFTYQLYWDKLEELGEQTLDKNVVRTLSSSCEVRGPYAAIVNPTPLVLTFNREVWVTANIEAYRWEQVFPADIDTTTNTIRTIMSWETGDPVTFNIFDDGQVLPAPIKGGTIYYVISVSPIAIQLAASFNDAHKGVPISIQDSGTSATNQFYIMRYLLEGVRDL